MHSELQGKCWLLTQRVTETSWLMRARSRVALLYCTVLYRGLFKLDAFCLKHGVLHLEITRPFQGTHDRTTDRRIHAFRIGKQMIKCMGPFCPPWNVTEMSWRQSVMVVVQDTLQLSSFVSSVSVRITRSIPSYWQPYPMLFAVMMVFQHVIGKRSQCRMLVRN